MGETTVKVVLPIITFLLGFIVSRLSMSKKERFDTRAKTLEISNKLDSDITTAFQEYQKALGKLSNAEKQNLNEFLEVESTGVAYFQALNSAASAVLLGVISRELFKSIHLSKVAEGYYRVIPKHYETLKYIAGRCGLDYSGKFRSYNYQAMESALEKYS